jgi:hypothetical protein
MISQGFVWLTSTYLALVESESSVLMVAAKECPKGGCGFAQGGSREVRVIGECFCKVGSCL